MWTEASCADCVTRPRVSEPQVTQQRKGTTLVPHVTTEDTQRHPLVFWGLLLKVHPDRCPCKPVRAAKVTASHSTQW